MRGTDKMNEKWTPTKIIDVDQQLPKFNLLKNALWTLMKNNLLYLPGSIRETLYDEMGTYGYVIKQFVLVAKDKPYGNIVSCHYTAILRCKEHEIPLVMWIQKSKRFYVFYADEIETEAKKLPEEGINYKGRAKMINFPVRIGRKITVSYGSMKVECE